MDADEERGATSTPAGFHLLLQGGGTGYAPCSGQRVVLLHGWMQSHAVWLRTAACLRDRLGHDVLLLDWWGHGLSHSDRPLRDLRIEVLLTQLEAALCRVGWLTPDSQKLCFAGISLGGALSLRFAAKHPERIGRLTLVCSAGLSEKWWALPSLTRPLRQSFYLLEDYFLRPLLGLSDDDSSQEDFEEKDADDIENTGDAVYAKQQTTLEKRRGERRKGEAVRWTWWPHFVRSLFGQLRLIETTPRYGVPDDMPQRLAVAGIPLHLIWGRLDWIHTAQIDRWRSGRPAAEVSARVFPFQGHVQLCSAIDGLELWADPELWRAPHNAEAHPTTGSKGKRASRKDVRQVLRLPRARL